MKHMRLSRSLLFGIGIMTLIVLLVLPNVLAREPSPGAAGGDDPAAPAGPLGVDDGILEVGVEWVEDYPAGWSDLPATRPDALGLYNTLGACGWTRRFAWGNGWAWEQDWKGLTKPGGGTEHVWIDTVDLAYFAGHGNSSGFFFGVGGNTIDDSQLHYNDCRLEWGNGDAEWVGIAACNVLANIHLGDWSWCMNGLHLILGMVTTMADVPHGRWFGAYICYGYNMTQAWFRASDALQPQGVVARVLAEEPYHFYDRPGNHIGGDTWDNDYYWWDHHVGSEPARHVNIQQLGGVMPIFQTQPLSLAEADARWSQLGQTFNVTTTTSTGAPLSLAGTQQEPVRVSLDGQLEMGNADGLYAYTNLQSLWATPPTTTLAGASPASTYRLTQQDVISIANQFLTSNGLMLSDAQFYEVAADTVTTVPTKTLGVSSPAALGALQSQTAAWQVIYSRILTYTPPVGVNGLQQAPIEFSVMGPGAKLKVYVSPEAPAGFSIAEVAQQSVIGGQGGWRRLTAPVVQSVQTVPILDYPQIEKLFEQLEPLVALSYVPLNFTSRQVLTYTVGYYEHPIGQGQDQLIPAYILDVQTTLVNQEVVTNPVYIPANETYMAPLALITPTAQIPSKVRVGQQIVFQAADASMPLSSLGYDASLNFALGTGDPDSYLYAWYRDTVAPENKLGDGRVLTYTVALSGETHGEQGPTTQTIILQVIDSLSPRTPNTSIAPYQLNIVPPVYLPLVMKNP